MQSTYNQYNIPNYSYCGVHRHYHNYKCADVYYMTTPNNSTSYNVICCACGKLLSMKEFPEHFQETHIANRCRSNVDAPKEGIQSNGHNVSGPDITMEKRRMAASCALPMRPIVDKICHYNCPCLGYGYNNYQMQYPQSCYREPREPYNSCYDEYGTWHNSKFKASEESMSELENMTNNEDIEDANVPEKNYSIVLSRRSGKLRTGLQFQNRLRTQPLKWNKIPTIHYKCKICGQLLRNKRQLIKHKTKHIGRKCDICGSEFIKVSSMMYNKMRQTGDKAQVCSDCNKYFFLEGGVPEDCNLKKHKRNRTEKKVFYKVRQTPNLPQNTEDGAVVASTSICQCDVPKAIPNRDGNESETNGNVAKICQLCGKRFYCFKYLTVSKYVKSTKQFMCKVCGVTFRRKKLLFAHRKLHKIVHNKKTEFNICCHADDMETLECHKVMQEVIQEVEVVNATNQG